MVTPYIAEYYNTISNVFICLSGLYGIIRSMQLGLETRFIVLSIGSVLVSLGSALFHGTLLYSFQMADELPMIFTMCVWNYALALTEIDHYKNKSGRKIR